METIEVKVGVMPGQINTYAIEAGMKISEVLSLAGLSSDGYTIRYNGNEAALDDEVNEAGTLLLAKQVKGNANEIEIKIGVMPGRIDTYMVEAGITVSSALEIADLDATGYTIRYNGNEAQLDDVINETGTLLLAKQVKGNF